MALLDCTMKGAGAFSQCWSKTLPTVRSSLTRKNPDFIVPRNNVELQRYLYELELDRKRLQEKRVTVQVENGAAAEAQKQAAPKYEEGKFTHGADDDRWPWA